MSKPVPFPPIIELDARASALLDVLVDLGHLDEASLERVNQVLASIEKPLNEHGMAALDANDVRRVAAMALFERVSELDGEARRMIEREWGLLFYCALRTSSSRGTCASSSSAPSRGPGSGRPPFQASDHPAQGPFRGWRWSCRR